MLLGTIGAGKTTLINGIVNYVYGVRWEYGFRFKLINDEGGKSQLIHSQTKWITAYTLYWHPESPLQYDLTVIDTPGFGDTERIARDKALVEQIKDLFSISPNQHGIDQIHDIGFVTQASLAWLTATQMYVFNSILSVFGKDVAENVFLLTTFADGKKPPVIEAARAAKVPFNKQGIFKFNNSAIFVDNREETTQSVSIPVTESDGDGDDYSFNEMFWKMGISSFQKFFQYLQTVDTKSLQLTKEVLHERHQLETTLNGIQPQIQIGLAKLAELEQVKDVLEKCKAAIIAYENFQYTVEVQKKKKIDLKAGDYATNCFQCNCTCHYPCAMLRQNEHKDGCWAMDDDGNCRICPRKCMWTMHSNNPYRFEIYTVVENRTLDDLKKKYDDATSGKTTQKTRMALKFIERELIQLAKKVHAMVCKAQASLKRLDQIALKPNLLTEVEYIELLIESEKLQAQNGWMDRVRVLENFLKQARLVARVRQKGLGSQPSDGRIDEDMVDESWWKMLDIAA